jgi:hypothetical protein
VVVIEAPRTLGGGTRDRLAEAALDPWPTPYSRRKLRPKLTA